MMELRVQGTKFNHWLQEKAILNCNCDAIFARMKSLRDIYNAVALDVFLEFRKGYAVGGLVVFVLCTAFIIYMSLAEISAEAWVALYWIAFLFMGVHAILKSFAQESTRRYLYYYTLIAPDRLFIAKCIFNSVLLTVLGLLMFGALSLITSTPVRDLTLFLSAILMGALAISLAFTFVSAIAIKSDNSATLMTILSFPIIIPVLLSVIKMSLAAVAPMDVGDSTNSFLILGSIDLILIALGLSLFPYLWKS